MSELQKDLYSASCNPPRRAKRVSIVQSLPPSIQSSHDRVTLPMRSTTPAVITDVIPPPPATAPAKRGRKPGPLSRSAREAQRRLNHSIIEKARRTKINDALATLRQLVPVDYGSAQPQNEPCEEDDDDDDEYPEEGAKRAKPKPKLKGAGKREEKEKEFKLEILVRTVSFLQDLLQRVDTMENSLPVCQHCGGAVEACRKRKHTQVYDEDDNDHKKRKIRRNAEEHSSKVLESHSISLIPTTEPQTNGNGSQARLPSISSWLPNDVIDPSLLPPQNKPKRSVSPNFPYLPSPPSSTHFDPIRTSQVPPLLNLGPVATAAMVTLSRTTEDESAASLLLQIAKSPPFRPSLATSSTNSSYNLPDPSKLMLHSDLRNQREGQVQPQTPRSLLGLHQGQKYQEQEY